MLKECSYKKYKNLDNSVEVNGNDKKCIDGSVKYEIIASTNASWCRERGYSYKSVTKNIRNETVPVAQGNKLCYFKIMTS